MPHLLLGAVRCGSPPHADVVPGEPVVAGRPAGRDQALFRCVTTVNNELL
jgi:hypothetical protein